MKRSEDIPEDVARLLEKRDKEDRRAAKPSAAAKPPTAERRKRPRRKPQ